MALEMLFVLFCTVRLIPSSGWKNNLTSNTKIYCLGLIGKVINNSTGSHYQLMFRQIYNSMIYCIKKEMNRNSWWKLSSQIVILRLWLTICRLLYVWRHWYRTIYRNIFVRVTMCGKTIWRQFGSIVLFFCFHLACVSVGGAYEFPRTLYAKDCFCLLFNFFLQIYSFKHIITHIILYVDTILICMLFN